MKSTETRPQQPGQVSNLPGVTTYITGHDQETGNAVVQSKRPGNWSAYDDKLMGFNVAYTTSSFPVSLNDDIDIQTHDALAATKKLGLVNPNGTVCGIVDFAPGFDCMMHRTQSLDYGIVLEAVQRATMHAWRNPSKDQWARMVFVLQDCQKVVLGNKELKEDLGRGVKGLPSSGNDQ